jgi:hypothetical protein
MKSAIKPNPRLKASFHPRGFLLAMLIMAGTLGVSDRSFSQTNLFAIQSPLMSWSLTATPGNQSSSGTSVGTHSANIGSGSLGAASVTLSLGGAVPGGLFYDPTVIATGTASNAVTGLTLTGNASSKIIYEFALVPLIPGNAGLPPSVPVYFGSSGSASAFHTGGGTASATASASFGILIGGGIASPVSLGSDVAGGLNTFTGAPQFETVQLNTIYGIEIDAQAMSSVTGIGMASAFATVDPTLMIDPSSPDAADYEIVSMPGIVIVPEPSLFALFGAIALLFALCRRYLPSHKSAKS